MHLRSYQTEAVRQCYEGWRSGHRRMLLCAPTGAGKTEMATRIAADCLARGWRTFFVVDQQNLTVQTVERMSRAGGSDLNDLVRADRGMPMVEARKLARVWRGVVG